MREIRTSGSEGGGTGNSTGSSYPYRVRGGGVARPCVARISIRLEERCATAVQCHGLLANARTMHQECNQRHCCAHEQEKRRVEDRFGMQADD